MIVSEETTADEPNRAILLVESSLEHTEFPEVEKRLPTATADAIDKSLPILVGDKILALPCSKQVPLVEMPESLISEPVELRQEPKWEEERTDKRLPAIISCFTENRSPPATNDRTETTPPICPEPLMELFELIKQFSFDETD